MAKYLLTGSDREMIFNILAAASNDNTIISTSEHSADISNHLKLFTPDAFIICAQNQTPEQLLNIKVALESLSQKGIPGCVIGTEDDFDIAFSYLGDEKIKKNIDRELPIQSILDQIKLMVMDAKAAAQEQAQSNPEQTADSAAEGQTSDTPLPAFTEDNDAPGLIPPLEGMSMETIPTAAPETKESQKSPLAIKKKILVIDDDPVMLKTIKLYLEDEYTVLTSLKGQLALNFLKTKTVDLILLDYEMPEMNGLEVIEKIRGNLRTSSLPVIFLTGVADVEKIKMIGKYNIQGYTLKPVNKDKLLESIKKVVHSNDDMLILQTTEKPETNTLHIRKDIKWKN